MKKIITPRDIKGLVNKLKTSNKSIVLAGGCFDILHPGHLAFLKNAKKHGTVIVLLESDKNVQKLKGDKRPINKQQERAKILSSINSVDYIVLLSEMKNNQDYAKLIDQIKPDIIAVTDDDLKIKQKRKQAKNIGAKIKVVIKRIKGESTTKLIKLIKK